MKEVRTTLLAFQVQEGSRIAEQSRATKMLEGALDGVKRLPSTMSADVAADVGRKRVRLSHVRAEAPIPLMRPQPRALCI